MNDEIRNTYPLKKIYLASSWRNPYQPEAVDLLRGLGHEVYDFRNPQDPWSGPRSDHGDGRDGVSGTGFSWSQIDPNWKGWSAEQYIEALRDPIADAGFMADFTAMHNSDTGVLLLPSGRSAHLEAGWLIAMNKPTVVVTWDGEEPELMAKMAGHIVIGLDGLRKHFTRKDI